MICLAGITTPLYFRVSLGISLDLYTSINAFDFLYHLDVHFTLTTIKVCIRDYL